jgi:hypothetical protein
LPLPFEKITNGSPRSSSGLVQVLSSDGREIRPPLKYESSDQSEGFESEEEGLAMPSSGVAMYQSLFWLLASSVEVTIFGAGVRGAVRSLDDDSGARKPAAGSEIVNGSAISTSSPV